MPFPALGRSPETGRYPGRKAQVLVPTGTLPRTVRYRRGKNGTLRTKVFSNRKPYMTDDRGEALVLRESFGFRQLTGLTEAIAVKRPLMYWPLDSVDGATDLTGNGRNGTGAGGIVIGTADSGTATRFDGVDDRITAAWSPYVNGTPRTFLGVASRDTDTNAHALISGTVATVAPYLRLDPAVNTVRWDAAAGAGDADTWASAWPSLNAWVFWALVFHEVTDTASLYIDGVLVSTVTHTDAYNSAPGNFIVGARNDTFDAFDGKMKHVAVFNRLLSAAEIATLADLV